MRYTVIDGRSYEVRECAECPFRDIGDSGWGAHCTHPLACQDPRTPLEIAFDGHGTRKLLANSASAHMTKL